jgi:hypothetical protein
MSLQLPNQMNIVGASINLIHHHRTLIPQRYHQLSGNIIAQGMGARIPKQYPGNLLALMIQNKTLLLLLILQQSIGHQHRSQMINLTNIINSNSICLVQRMCDNFLL